jgi:hypothetical protein
MNISYFFKQEHIPQEAKNECAKILKYMGYTEFLAEFGYTS